MAEKQRLYKYIYERPDKLCVLRHGASRKTNNHNISMQRNYIYYILHYDFKFSINQIGKCFKRSGREINYRISEMKYRIEYFKDYRAKYVDLYDYALNHIGFKGC